MLKVGLGSFQVVRDSPFAEKIIQVGKKKLVLDHLIVQRLDHEDEAEDVQSILTYGAKALFEEQSDTADINCVCITFAVSVC